MLIFTLLLLTACTLGCFGEEKVNYEYTEEYVSVVKIGGDSTLISGNLQVTTDGENKYYFDRWISEDDRAEFIKAQKKICNLLIDNGIEAKGLNIYVLSDVADQAMKTANSMYINIASSGKVDQINLTLQLIFGEYTNYGYIYSLSNHIANKLRWKGDGNFSLDESLFTDNTELLNLVYPCFSSDYYSENEIASCKALAKMILGKMSDAYKGEDEFLRALDEYTKQKGFGSERTYLAFALGDSESPLKIKTNYLEVYLDKDYQGSCLLTEKSILEDPMFNFKNMIEFWEYADSDIAEVRSHFGFDGDYTVPVFVKDINRSLPQAGDVGGLFVPNGVKILMEDIYTITHEYTHYLDYCVDENSADDNWCTEVLACYYGKNMSYIERVVRASSGDPNVWSIEQLSDLIGNPYDSTDDEIIFMNIMNAYEENPKYAVTHLYNGRLSFGNYFVTTYGEEAFIHCMTTPGAAGKTIGCDINQVVDDWIIWLEQWRILDIAA